MFGILPGFQVLGRGSYLKFSFRTDLFARMNKLDWDRLSDVIQITTYLTIIPQLLFANLTLKIQNSSKNNFINLFLDVFQRKKNRGKKRNWLKSKHFLLTFFFLPLLHHLEAFWTELLYFLSLTEIHAFAADISWHRTDIKTGNGKKLSSFVFLSEISFN